MAKVKISYAPSVRRLPSYLHIIRLAERNRDFYISGTVIAQELNLEPIQVRKDLAITGIVGKAIEHYLGWDQNHVAVLVGAGNLGSALMGYQEFQRHGLRIVAAFDTDPQKVGSQVHGVPVRAMESMEQGIRAIAAEIAILTVPSPFAQATSEILVRAGITSIWNFTNTKLKVPDQIVVQREDLSSGYALLSVQMLAKKSLGV
jgi:redox-sensing transcriptional repressor